MVVCTQNIIENTDMLFNAKSIKKINKDAVVFDNIPAPDIEVA